MLGARMFDTLEAIATSAREDDHPAYYLTRGDQSKGFQRWECAHADTSGITEQTCSRRVETTAIGTIRRSDVAGSSDFGTTSAIIEWQKQINDNEYYTYRARKNII